MIFWWEENWMLVIFLLACQETNGYVMGCKQNLHLQDDSWPKGHYHFEKVVASKRNEVLGNLHLVMGQEKKLVSKCWQEVDDATWQLWQWSNPSFMLLTSQMIAVQYYYPNSCGWLGSWWRYPSRAWNTVYYFELNCFEFCAQEFSVNSNSNEEPAVLLQKFFWLPAECQYSRWWEE